MVGSVSLDIENVVYRKETNSLLTGVFAEDGQNAGWVYDIRLLQDAANPASLYLTTIGGHAHGLLDGFAKEDWTSGTVTGLKFDGIKLHWEDNKLHWVPKYSTGSFTIYNQIRRLYSDYSHMNVLLEDDTYSISSVALTDGYKENTITVAIYKRLEDGLIVAEKSFNYVNEFTGAYIGPNEREETSDETGFLVSNFSDRHNEYLILDDKLYLNDLYQVKVGLGSSVEDIEATWEEHTIVAGGYVYLRYLNPTDLTVVAVHEGVATELTSLSSLDYTTESQVGYVLDSDLGVLQLTGVTASSVVCKEDINNIATSILCYFDADFEALPERGVVQIGVERIAYQAKGLQSLEECIRGYEGTEATTHSAGDIIEFVQRGTAPVGILYVKYTAVPRVDYEITSATTRTANRANWLDVHPLANLKHNKIIQLQSQTINLAEVVLSTDESIIGGNLYGPVYFGTDVGRLVATGYDAAGNPVEDIELTIEKLYGPGSLNNSGDIVVGESNSSGEVYAQYNAPYDQIDTTLEVNDIVHDGDDTVITVSRLPAGVVPNDIYLYQIFKHDPTLGTVGKKVTVIGGGSAVAPWGAGYIDCRCEYTEDFNNGTVQVVYSNVRYSLNINHAVLVNVPGDEPFTRFYVEEFFAWMTSSPFDTTTVAWLYQEDAEVWDSVLKRGAQVIVYEWSNSYRHPRTNAVGAYGPVRPQSISGTTLRYVGRHLPIPDPTDDSSNLGAYVIVSPAEARFRAYGRDPYSGSMITSNQIRYRVALPNTLSGIDSSGVLPVPYGFTFITDDFNVGAGLGGSNFITINPSASGINQLTLRGSI